jgi:hypothetical protein
MSYLARYVLLRPALSRQTQAGARVDERIVLNLPEYDGGAHVRTFVEDTSRQRGRRGLPTPRLKLRITDCSNQVHLEFSVDTAEDRENSLHKIDTLIAALDRFRAGLVAEAELRAERERTTLIGRRQRCRT